jgi:voltage-gated potassium channel Kch
VTGARRQQEVERDQAGRAKMSPALTPRGRCRLTQRAATLPRDVSARPRPRPRGRRFAERITLLRAFAAIMAVTTAFTLAAALVERLVEPDTFTSYGKAWWWAAQTVATVGYGDITPQTTAGRLVATTVMIFGIALVPTATSIVVAILLDRHRRDP